MLYNECPVALSSVYHAQYRDGGLDPNPILTLTLTLTRSTATAASTRPRGGPWSTEEI